MSGRFYYYGGGGNSPYGWVAWVIGLAVFVGLGILLLPIVGAIVLILAAVVIEEIDRENRSDNNRKNS